MSPEQVRPGLLLLDEAWGGLDRGGCYLILGRVSAGLHLPALHLVRAAAERAEPCLYLSALAPEALAHESARIGFDVAGAVRDGRVRLLRRPASLVREEPDDAARARAFADLAALVEANRPALLVLDGFAPMARFSAFASFAAAFAALHGRLAATGTTVVLTMDEPANAAAERVVAFVRGRAAGAAHMTGAPDSTLRTLALHGTEDPAPEGIKYLDLSTASASAPPDDSFSTLSYGAALSGRGHFVSAGTAHRDGQRRVARADADPFAHALLGTTTTELCVPNEHVAAPIDADVFEDVDLSAALRLFAPPPLPPEPPPAPAPPDPRLAFVLAFNEALAARADGGEPFLAVALRMPPGHPSARHFHFVVRAVEGTLGARDRLLADEARCGLVVLLPGRTAGTAQLLFATLKMFLHAAATSEADHILQAVSALVVPDGRPFPNATEFLLHAFDKE